YGEAINGQSQTLSNTVNYTYDRLNRFLSSNSTLNATDEAVTYDNSNMGNIMTLIRNGQSAANLSYNYLNGGNELGTVKNNNVAYRTYMYDENGNTKNDGGSKTISYNLLNLPQNITQTGVSPI